MFIQIQPAGYDYPITINVTHISNFHRNARRGNPDGTLINLNGGNSVWELSESPESLTERVMAALPFIPRPPDAS